MDKQLLATVLSAVMCSTSTAAVFRPTDTTVNFFTLYGAGIPMALFDDQDPTFAGAYLAIQAGGDQVLFQPAGPDYQVTNFSGQSPSAFTLSGSDHFMLAAWSPSQSAWLAPDAIFCSPLSGSCALSWSGLLVGFAVDLAESASPVPAPLLASLYLLGSGVFGLAAIGRRRSRLPLPIAH